jgi:hypothetical protein
MNFRLSHKFDRRRLAFSPLGRTTSGEDKRRYRTTIFYRGQKCRLGSGIAAAVLTGLANPRKR